MKLRTQRGIHSLELVGGLMVLVPIVLYGIDYATVLYGGQMNASCCSAACRSAAQGPPTGYGLATNTPKSRASTTLARMAQPAAVIRVKKTVRTNEIVNTPIPQDPYGGPFLGNVTVKTRCDVFPPFLLPFVSQQVTLYTSQTYPWTYVMAASYQTKGGSGNGSGSIGSNSVGAGGQSLNFMRMSPLTNSGGGGGNNVGATNDIMLPIPDNAP